ncbi:ATP-dependent DNA ligase [archaeon]|jgi:DNA ligase 1|nr:ATP-dependent DNA ligase [archaeon]
MKYIKLAEFYKEVSSTTKRLEKTAILAKFLKGLTEEDKDILYLLEGGIYPEYDERKIGISGQLALKAIAKATGTPNSKLVKEWKAIGDIGLVAEKFTLHKKQTTLGSTKVTTKKVIDNLRKLPELVGAGTVNKKIALITELLTSAEPIEALYLVRTLIGDLRIGVQEGTIREALALAYFKGDKESAETIQRAIDKSNDLGLVFVIARKKKLTDLKKINLQLGKPIKAMLAQKAKTIEEGFKNVGKPCMIEYKYDGFRLLIHKDKDKVTLFTRMLENVTKQFPEVTEYVNKYVKSDSCILDSEAVGFNKKTKEYTDFQAISQRIRRKHNIEELQKKLPVEVNVFDILYYNGKSELDTPFEKRAKLVRKILKDHPYKIISSKTMISSDVKKVEKFYKQALKDNQEGIMMKALDAEYKPGRRVGHMLKIKPSERDLDLVITGAEYGKGKRKGWMSSFILSCKGDKKGEYLEIGKVGTGIAEKDNDITFESLTKMLTPLIIKEKGNEVKLKPKIIVAVTYQEIQKSPNYESKWALRFPRFTALRNDKPLSEIADLKEVQEDFLKQKRNYRYG